MQSFGSNGLTKFPKFLQILRKKSKKEKNTKTSKRTEKARERERERERPSWKCCPDSERPLRPSDEKSARAGTKRHSNKVRPTWEFSQGPTWTSSPPGPDSLMLVVKSNGNLSVDRALSLSLSLAFVLFSAFARFLSL